MDGRPVARVAPALELELRRLDLSAMPAASRRRAADEALAEAAARPFELATGPLVRAALVRLDDSDHLLQIGMHHMLCDGASLDVLQDELGRLYAAAVAGETAALPELPLRYSDTRAGSVGCSTAGAGGGLGGGARRWRAPRRPSSAHRLPAPAPQRSAGGANRWPRPPRSRPCELGVREGASLFMVRSRPSRCAHAPSGVEDVVVGTPVSGRNGTEVEGLVGFFINTLVLRNDLRDGRASASCCGACMSTLATSATRSCPSSWSRAGARARPEPQPDLPGVRQPDRVPAGAGPALPGLQVERAGGWRWRARSST